MKSYNDIEKKMKQLAGSQKTPPPAMVWDKIDASLNDKPKRRFGYLWLTLGVFIFIAGGFFYNSFQNSSTKGSKINIHTKPSTLTESNHGSTIKNIDDNISNSKSTINLEETEINDKPIANQNKTTHSNEIVSTDIKEIIKDVAVKKSSFKTTKKNNHTKHSIEKNTVLEVNIKENKTIPILPSSLKNQFDTSVNTKKLPIEITAIQRLKNKLLFDIKWLVLAFTKASLNNTDADEKESKFYVEMSTLIGFHNKDLEGDETSKNLILSRKNSERPWYTYGGKFNIGYNIFENISIGTGIHWTQAKEKFYHEENELRFIDAYPTFGKLVDTGEVKYTMIDVPLFINYRKQASNGLYFGTELGLVYNLSFSGVGKILNEDLYISYTSSEDSQRIYNKRQGLGFSGSLVFGKEFNNGLCLNIKPTFKQYLSRLNRDGYTINTTMQFFTLDVGLKKYL